jgi:hypothetical protein
VSCEDKFCQVEFKELQTCLVFDCESSAYYPCHLDKCQRHYNYDMMCKVVQCFALPEKHGHWVWIALGLGGVLLAAAGLGGAFLLRRWRRRVVLGQEAFVDEENGDDDAADDDEEGGAAVGGGGGGGAEGEDEDEEGRDAAAGANRGINDYFGADYGDTRPFVNQNNPTISEMVARGGAEMLHMSGLPHLADAANA